MRAFNRSQPFNSDVYDSNCSSNILISSLSFSFLGFGRGPTTRLFPFSNTSEQTLVTKSLHTILTVMVSEMRVSLCFSVSVFLNTYSYERLEHPTLREVRETSVFRLISSRRSRVHLFLPFWSLSSISLSPSSSWLSLTFSSCDVSNFDAFFDDYLLDVYFFISKSYAHVKKKQKTVDANLPCLPPPASSSKSMTSLRGATFASPREIFLYFLVLAILSNQTEKF